jgi:hypothetical protein
VADERLPFADVRLLEDGSVSIPRLKWRELLFIGALRPEGSAFVRDSSRPLPPFERQGLFPEGFRFEVTQSGDRMIVRRQHGPGDPGAARS